MSAPIATGAYMPSRAGRSPLQSSKFSVEISPTHQFANSPTHQRSPTAEPFRHEWRLPLLQGDAVVDALEGLAELARRGGKRVGREKRLDVVTRPGVAERPDGADHASFSERDAELRLDLAPRFLAEGPRQIASGGVVEKSREVQRRILVADSRSRFAQCPRDQRGIAEGGQCVLISVLLLRRLRSIGGSG